MVSIPARRVVSFILLLCYAALAVAVCMAFAKLIQSCQALDCGDPRTWLFIVFSILITAPGLVLTCCSVCGRTIGGAVWDLVVRTTHSIFSIVLTWTFDYAWYEGISFVSLGYAFLASLEIILYGKKAYWIQRGSNSNLGLNRDKCGGPKGIKESKNEQLYFIQHYQDGFGNLFSLTAYPRIYQGLEPTRILFQVQGKTAEISEIKVAQVMNSGMTFRITAESASHKLFDPLIVNLKFQVHQAIERVDYNLSNKSYTYYLGVVKKTELGRKNSIALGELSSGRKLSTEIIGIERVRQVRFSLPALGTRETLV